MYRTRGIKLMKSPHWVLILIIIFILPGAASGQNYYLDDGGSGINLIVIRPTGSSLPGEEEYLLDYIQNLLLSNFKKYTAINADRSFSTSNIEGTETALLLSSVLSKTGTTYRMDLTVTDLNRGRRVAAYLNTNVNQNDILSAQAINAGFLDIVAQLNVKLSPAGVSAVSNPSKEEIEASLNPARGTIAKKSITSIETRDKKRERENRKSAKEEIWNAKKLKSRRNFYVSALYNPGFADDWENALAFDVGLGFGFKNFSVDGRLVYPLYQIMGTGTGDLTFGLGFGVTLGYSFVWDSFMASMEGGATWYRNVIGTFATVPTFEVKFDIAPWEPGIGLRLSYKLELGFPDGSGLYDSLFTNVNSFGINSFRMIGTPAVGIVLWY
jgi:hypothetical protein